MPKCPQCGGTGEVRDDREVGAEYRKRREKTGLSMRQIAAALRLSPSYLSDLELGRRRWSASLLKDYEKVLKHHTPKGGSDAGN